MAATSFATAPAFFPQLGWDPVKDFAPVSMVATVPIIVVVHPSVAATNARELIAYSKANPGKLNLASPGAATLTRLAGEMFKQAAGLDWVTVHYKGGPPAVTDLLGGQAQIMFANISDVITHVKAGKLRALAVTTAKRSAIAPELPTLAESALPGFEVSTWQAVLAPAGTPREIVQRLNAEIVKAMAAAGNEGEVPVLRHRRRHRHPRRTGALSCRRSLARSARSPRKSVPRTTKFVAQVRGATLNAIASRILAAALEEFARYGLGGARVDRIAGARRRQQAHAVLLLRQ